MPERIRSFLTAKHIFFILFLIGLTVQWPFTGQLPLELALIDLVLAVICLVWVARTTDIRQSILHSFSHPILWILMAWAGWALLLWLASSDWAYLINETRWLLLSIAAFAFLISILREGWTQKIGIFLAVATLTALITDIQGLTGFFKPPFTALFEKEIWISATESFTQPVAVGFFRHPNAYGAFVFWPLLLMAGFLADRKKRLIAILGVLFFAASLYLSYYRTLFLGVGFALAVYFLLQSTLPTRLTGWLIAGMAVLGVLGSALALRFFPTLAFFDNLWYRVRLWEISVTAILREPVILLFGSGFTPSGQLMSTGARSDPHNAYIYMVMHYGLPGLLIFLAIIWMVVREGWKAYCSGSFRREPLLAVLWSGLLAWFLTDLIDSRLSTPEWQMLFILVLALFFSRLEQGAAGSAAVHEDPTPAGKTDARIRMPDPSRLIHGGR
jgi:hypothetical protein